ncbi:uncharacterized protein LOC135848608 [Planococcus citri]|uniref:uncharacterized protein LOC135848608 n=1 Tax=Planococcus citri TaxID=170843 RepID=UPI0031F7C043
MSLLKSSLKTGIQTVRPFFVRSAVTGLKGISVRLSHDHGKPLVPVNPAPNDHLSFKVVTLDDLPKPELDYYEDYRAKQKKYWMHFFFGTGSLIATLYYMWAYEPIFFNAFPPELPPKEERIKSFWDAPDDDDDDD